MPRTRRPISPSPFRSQQPRNHLLAALPSSDLDRLSRHLEPVALRLGQVLQEWDEPAEHAFFIETGAASLLARTVADQPVEVGLAGRMDMIGLPLVLGTMHAPLRAVVQIPGTAFRINANRLLPALTRSPAVRQILLSYVQAMMVQHAQLALCNTRHPTETRVARWMALALDHLDDDNVPITHDLLSRLLGVRRASVTTAVAQIAQAGILRAQRGYVQVLDRSRLNQLTCGCYRIIRSEYDRFLIPRHA